MANTYFDVQDKSAWGEGPWLTEPDKATWVDPATDLDCMIVRNQVGALCGYVGVTQEHVFFGRSFDEVNVRGGHGGINFSQSCQTNAAEEASVCHIPEPGRSDEVWWFGFDCSHGWDYCPAMEATLGSIGIGPRYSDLFADQTYRDWDYVKEQVEQLALEIKAAA